jgi:hypothetical protein
VSPEIFQAAFLPPAIPSTKGNEVSSNASALFAFYIFAIQFFEKIIAD